MNRAGDGQWHLTTHTRSDSSVELAALGGAIVVAESSRLPIQASNSTKGAADGLRWRVSAVARRWKVSLANF